MIWLPVSFAKVKPFVDFLHRHGARFSEVSFFEHTHVKHSPHAELGFTVDFSRFHEPHAIHFVTTNLDKLAAKLSSNYGGRMSHKKTLLGSNGAKLEIKVFPRVVSRVVQHSLHSNDVKLLREAHDYLKQLIAAHRPLGTMEKLHAAVARRRVARRTPTIGPRPRRGRH